MKNKLLILLFEIGFRAYVEYIGQISISEIFLIVFAFTYLTRSLFQSAIIQKLTIIYSVLLLAQFFSEIMSNNSIDNAYKGYAVTIISYLHLMFLSSQFKKNKSLIIYVLIGILLRGFIFGSSKEGSIDEALSGEAAGFLKFYLAPMIMSGLLVLSMLSPRKSMALIFCFVGIVLIALGARSMEPLKEALEQSIALTDEDLKQMGLNGRKLVEERYSSRMLSEKMVNLYNQLL